MISKGTEAIKSFFEQKNTTLKKVEILSVKILMLTISLLIISTSCTPNEKDNAHFEDYSFITNKGIHPISVKEEGYKHKGFEIVADANKSYREIYPQSHTQEHIEKIGVYETKKGDVYKVMYKYPVIGKVSDFFFIFKNDSLVRYNIVSTQEDNLNMALNIMTGTRSLTYHFTINKNDTINFINRIFEFNNCCIKELEDSVFIKLESPITTLNGLDL